MAYIHLVSTIFSYNFTSADRLAQSSQIWWLANKFSCFLQFSGRETSDEAAPKSYDRLPSSIFPLCLTAK